MFVKWSSLINRIGHPLMETGMAVMAVMVATDKDVAVGGVDVAMAEEDTIKNLIHH